MRLWIRLLLATFILAIGLGAQAALEAHFTPIKDVAPGVLVRPLSEVPLALGSWRGEELPVEEKLRIGDEHLRRTYRHAETGQVVSLWMVYSATGQDRGHHPEVCMAVAGQPEDQSARTTCPLPGQSAPAQQYKFGIGSHSQWVFYWHYTLPAAGEETWTSWQQLYRRLRQRPASVTLEVFAPCLIDEQAEAAREFVQLVDAAAQAQVGAQAVRSSERLPVTIVPGPAPEAR